MPTRRRSRAAKRIATFAAALSLSLFCALAFFSYGARGASSAQKSGAITTMPTRTPAPYDPARRVAVVVGADYTVTTTGGAIVLTDVSGNGDTLIVAEPAAGQIKFAAVGRTFSVDGGAPLSGDSGNLSLSGINAVTVNQGGGDDTLSMQAFTSALPGLTVNGDAGNDTVNFSGSITFAANASLNANLQDDSAAPGTDSAVVASGVQLITSGTGTIDVRVSKSVIVGGRLQTQNGNLTVEANRQPTATSGAFTGVGVAGGTIQTTGTGNVNVKGTGGAGDFTDNYGVQVASGGQILSTGGGTIIVFGDGGEGSGGASAGSSNIGVYVTGSGSLINSTGGDVQVTGHGGTTNDSNVMGVALDELGTIETDGAGTLNINGTGGTVNGGGSTTFVNSGGVFIVPGDVNGDGGIVMSTGTGANAGAIVINGVANPGGNGSAQGVRVDAPGTVTTVDASISITGTSAACGNACLGTSIRGQVAAGGTGSINLTGTGADSTGAFPTHGVNVRSGGNVSTKDGDINVNGTGGNGTDTAGFNLAPTGAGTLQTTGNGNVLVNADAIVIRPTAAANINAGTHAVTLRQKTSGTAVNLGSTLDSTPNTLELSDAELDRITAGTINVGDADSGAINVSANITRAASTNLNLTSAANIDINGGSLGSAGGNVALNPGTNTFPSIAGVDVNAGATGTLTLASAKDLKVVIDNTTPDTGYTQLNVAGHVNLGGANLSLSGSHTPAPGQTFVVVNNDGADAITGTFNGLPEGGTITNFFGSGLSASITYAGGDGNDAVLTVFAPPSLSIDDVTHAEGNAGTTAFTFTVNKTGAGAASVSFTTQDGTAASGSDYTSNSGTLTFASNETAKQFTVLVNGDTTPELDESFDVLLTNPSNANISDGKGTGTITNDDESVAAGQLIISEFRLRGPGTLVGDRPVNGSPVRAVGGRLSPEVSGSDVDAPQRSVSSGRSTAPPEVDTSPEANDEFVELYNNTDNDLLVTTTDGSRGWTVVASGGTELFFIPDGTVLPARAHYLGTNAVGYSLNSYATGDTAWAGVEVPDNAGLALFRTNEPTNYGMETRLDAVGSTAETDALYKEGAGYTALAPADISLNLEHSFYRDLCSFANGVGCTTAGRPKDSGDNAADFLFVDTKGTQTAAGRRLGAPGPENLSSPVERNADFGFLLLDRTKSNSAAPNRDRNFSPADPNNAPNGKLTIRRRVTNNTGAPIIALRFRVIELTTYPAPPGTADLRAISAEETESVSNVGDTGTCGADPAPCTVMVQVTTLETPPTQAQGGGYNSTLSAGTVTLDSPLGVGESVNLQFVLGVAQGGTFRILLNVEAVDDAPVPERQQPKPGRR
jgi:hypothetical protein